MNQIVKLGADISRCLNGDCVLRERCLRYLSPPQDENQCFILGLPSDGTCEEFWDVSKQEPKP